MANWMAMSKSDHLARACAVALAILALGACTGKETGPDDSATAAAAPMVAPSVPSATANPAVAKPLASFAGKDTDGDGRITSAEYARAAQTMFQMMDADHDGTVNVAEVDAARTAMGRSKAVSSQALVAAADSDNDGKLTLSEWMASANAAFDKMDTNQDGVIDKAEWNAANPDNPADADVTPAAPSASASPVHK